MRGLIGVTLEAEHVCNECYWQQTSFLVMLSKACAQVFITGCIIYRQYVYQIYPFEKSIDKYTLRGMLPYFFGYKTEFFSFQNNPKGLDTSYKMDLDLSDCLGRVKLALQQNFIGLI